MWMKFNILNPAEKNNKNKKRRNRNRNNKSQNRNTLKLGEFNKIIIAMNKMKI